MQKTELCITVLYGNRVPSERHGKWECSHPGAATFGNLHLHGICRELCKTSLPTSIRASWAHRIFTSEEVFTGYHTRNAREWYPSQWVDDMLLFSFSVTTQKCDKSLCALLQLILEGQKKEKCLPETFNQIWYLEPSLIFALFFQTKLG